MNYSELLQLVKGWSNLVSNRIIIWRLLSNRIIIWRLPTFDTRIRNIVYCHTLFLYSRGTDYLPFTHQRRRGM